MPQLFVLSGSLVGRTFDISGPAVLGRGPDCDVVLADRSVSREHARLEPTPHGWRILDLGSRNGIKLHGERVEEASLQDLDEILLGELVLRFRTTTDLAEPAPPPRPLTPAAPPRPFTPPAPGAPPARPPPPAEDAFALEEEIELEVAPTLGSPAPRRAPIELTDRDRERARLLARTPTSGFFSGDLAQWPLALRWTAYAAVLAVLCAAFYGAFWLVARLRGG